MLPTLTEIQGPKFVFAHILAPHDPFVFDEEGNSAYRRTPFSMNNDPEFTAGYGWDEYSMAYVAELKYLHREVLNLVKTIINESDTPPVIILQGDHGIPRSGNYSAQFEIYNAYYFAGNEYVKVADTISPVNSFRLVFNTIFGTDYPMLKNESFQYDHDADKFSRFTTPFTCP